MSDDEIITINGTNYSMKKCFDDNEAWEKYKNASEKVKELTKIVIRQQLRHIDHYFKKWENKAVKS